MDSQTPQPTPPRKRWLPSPGAALMAVVLVSLVAYGSLQDGGPTNQELQTARNAVADCWKISDRKEGSPDDQRARTADCELRESAFRKKYGGNSR